MISCGVNFVICRMTRWWHPFSLRRETPRSLSISQQEGRTVCSPWLGPAWKGCVLAVLQRFPVGLFVLSPPAPLLPKTFFLKGDQVTAFMCWFDTWLVLMSSWWGAFLLQVGPGHLQMGFWHILGAPCHKASVGRLGVRGFSGPGEFAIIVISPSAPLWTGFLSAPSSAGVSTLWPTSACLYT